MFISKNHICDGSVARIASIFKMSIEDIKFEMKFSSDFKASFVSDFRRNEFDHIADDIRDVADRKISKELDAGTLVISTVGDYCEHMVRCHSANPEKVVKLLNLER
jgi:hypothetical protein